MDSHEERVYAAVRQTQERDAKQKMRERAKEISKLQRTQQLQQRSVAMSPMSGISSSPDSDELKIGSLASGGSTSGPSASSITSTIPARPKGMKLKAPTRNISFEDNE